jgi:hypothetical protein
MALLYTHAHALQSYNYRRNGRRAPQCHYRGAQCPRATPRYSYATEGRNRRTRGGIERGTVPAPGGPEAGEHTWDPRDIRSTGRRTGGLREHQGDRRAHGGSKRHQGDRGVNPGGSERAVARTGRPEGPNVALHARASPFCCAVLPQPKALSQHTPLPLRLLG